MIRKEELIAGEVYHIFNKSISDFKIFNNNIELLRMMHMFRYYQINEGCIPFCHFMRLNQVDKNGCNRHLFSVSKELDKSVQVIACCIMPTHLHLVLKQLKEKGISIFMGNVLNSYSRYFNIKHKRKGPLWEGRFQNVLVKTDEQLLHLTRYIHLNPVTAYLVDHPQDWIASSYNEYLLNVDEDERICKYDDILDVEPVSYKEFVEDGISYQRDLAKIKELLLE